MSDHSEDPTSLIHHSTFAASSSVAILPRSFFQGQWRQRSAEQAHRQNTPLLDGGKGRRRAITYYITTGCLRGSQLRAIFHSPSADFLPTQPPAAWQPFTRDALYPKREPSTSHYLTLGEWPRLPSTARINDPSKLARFSSHGMAPVLVPLRPSSEHILIVRAPGARDRHGCHSIPIHRARSASKGGRLATPPTSFSAVR